MLLSLASKPILFQQASSAAGRGTGFFVVFCVVCFVLCVVVSVTTRTHHVPTEAVGAASASS